MDREPARTVWFHRRFGRLTGGNLKHAHYFAYVRGIPGLLPRITFSGLPPDAALAQEYRQVWSTRDHDVAARWNPESHDVLFLGGGVDWLYLAECGLEGLANPRINLIQQIHKEAELYRHLAKKAIRICVSKEIADALAATGRVNGPLLTTLNGCDITPFEPDGDGLPSWYEKRRVTATIVGYKRPDLARELSRALDAEGTEHVLATDFRDRDAFLGLLAESRVAVCLPREEEGFYLLALEAMASGCIVVTLDCIGNRGFCHDGENCLIAEPNSDSLWRTSKRAMGLSGPERARIHQRARDTAVEYSQQAERAQFGALLADIDQIWRRR